MPDYTLILGDEIILDSPATVQLSFEGDLTSTIELDSELHQLLIDEWTVEITGVGLQGPPGDTIELYDSDTPPVGAPDTYLRFDRDIDGDVQTIYLGTVD